MNDLPRQQLKQIIDRYGRAVAADPQRCEALLRDFCGRYRKEISVLVSAVRESVPVDLDNSQHRIPSDLLLAQLTKRLEDRLAIDPAAARWSVESWAIALGLISESDCSERSTIIQANTNQKIDPIESPKLGYLKSKQLRKTDRQIVLSVSIGIDNSTAAIYRFDRVVSLVNISSAIIYTSEGKCFSVYEDIVLESSSIITSTFYKFIYFIGRSIDEFSSLITEVNYRVAAGSNQQAILYCDALERWVSPEELFIELLCEILNRCGDQLDTHVERIILTVPPFLNSIFCQEIIKHSAELVGIEVVRIWDETLAYGVTDAVTNGRIGLSVPNISLAICVNKFYIAGCILEIGDGVVEVLGKFLRWIAFREFSESEAARLTIESVEYFLQSSHITSVDAMVLPIIFAKLPQVKAMYDPRLADKVSEIIWSQEIAAYGAALMAGKLKNMLILDTAAVSVGIKTKQGITKIISANTTIPTKKSKLFLWKGNSSQIVIPIIEEQNAKDRADRILGIIYLDLPATDRLSVIEIIFDIDENRILNITAIDRVSENNRSLTVTSQSLLSPATAIDLDDDRSLLTQAIGKHAIWHRSNADRPVTIDGFMGVKNGDIYLKIEDYQTGIKLQELEFTDRSN